jgi:hypothetical protein
MSGQFELFDYFYFSLSIQELKVESSLLLVRLAKANNPTTETSVIRIRELLFSILKPQYNDFYGLSSGDNFYLEVTD